MLNRQSGEKGFDFGSSHFSWMAFVMEQDELPNPIDVCAFGCQCVMQQSTLCADLVQKFRTT